MKKLLAILLTLTMILTAVGSLAEGNGTPPEPPSGGFGGGMPQGGPGGTPPDGTPPDGFGGEGGPGGMMGGPDGMGGGSQPDSYDAVQTYSEDAEVVGQVIASTGADENAVLVTDGTVSVSGSVISLESDDSTGGDASSFYGVGAAVLVTGGVVKVDGSEITTDSAGGAGVFAYGDGVAYVSDTIMTTQQGTSGGIHVAGGGTLYAKDLVVETSGGSAAAIRSDRGGGTMVVDGGTYTSNGSGSPAVYVTADITINNATLTATGSEALCLEGLNSVRLYDCDLTGMMKDDSQNDNTWTMILYQSMSGDSQIGKGTFEMVGGSLTSTNGGLFYTTNTESEFVISNVEITAAEDSEYFLRVTGNSNQRGWGSSGANGADCKFTAIAQVMNGDVIYDSISNLDMYLLDGSVLTGAFIDDESNAGNGGNGAANLYIAAGSKWVVTADSALTALYAAGEVVDANGDLVSIVGTDGTVYVTGTSSYSVTVQTYEAACDTANAGTVGSFADYAVEFRLGTD